MNQTEPTPRQVLDLAISEDEFLASIIETAKLYGWRVHHDRPAKSNKGWRTPIQGDPGFLDLFLARLGSPLVLWEVKREGGKLTKGQVAWLRIVQRAGIVTGAVYPSDWETIQEVLAWEEWRTEESKMEAKKWAEM